VIAILARNAQGTIVQGTSVKARSTVIRKDV